MAPDDKAERRKQHEQEAETIASEEPGLKHTEHPQHNSGNQAALDTIKGRLRDAIAQPAREYANRVDKKAEDGEKDNDKGDGLCVHNLIRSQLPVLDTCAVRRKEVQMLTLDIEADGVADAPLCHTGDDAQEGLAATTNVNDGFDAKRLNEADFA